MKILLLAGGDSSERTVSLESGQAVYEALKRLDHIVYAIDPLTGKSLLNSDGTFIEYKSEESAKVNIPAKSSWSLASTLGSPAFQDIDVVFIALHGGSGEDGILQCLLEMSGMKYSGSNMAASAIAMDKAITKRICISENIKTAEFSVYRLRNQNIDDRMVHEIANRFHFPVIVKPNNGGSTIGLSKVDDEAQLHDALDKALLESGNVLVEKYIKGREITAAVFDGKPYPLVEIIPQGELYDFEAKYIKGKSEYITPAKIGEDLTKSIQQAAMKIFNLIGCSGLARVDFILDEKNNFYFLELNSLPGMTELSLAPMAAAEAGISFEHLIADIIKTAMNR